MAQQQYVGSAVYECLNLVLSPDSNSRSTGEGRIAALEVTEEYGEVLARIAVNPSEGIPLRQLAAVMLRQYVEHHWSALADKFNPPEVSPQVKAVIRSLLSRCLTEPESRVRSSLAFAMSTIAHWDWPEEWPELFLILEEALSSTDTNAVQGSMKVLSEFTREVTDTHMPSIVEKIFPRLYAVFTTPGVYSHRTRSRAVVIFATCTTFLSESMRGKKAEAQSLKNMLTSDLMKKFIEAFIHSLQSADDLVTDTGIKTEVMKVFTNLVKSVPSLISPHFAPIVSCVYSLLVNCSQIYLNTVVNELDAVDDPVDSDGDILSTESLIYSIFEFIHALVDKTKYQSVIKSNIQQLLYYILMYMQITAEQEIAWSESPSQFVEDEDEDSFSYSVRISAQDLYLCLVSEFEEEGLKALTECIKTHIEQAEQLKTSGSNVWWKVHEAVLLAFGNVRMMLADAIKEGRVVFNILEFLHNVVLTDLKHPGISSFLSGRCLWMASRFTHVMDIPTIQAFLSATLEGLSESQPATVRISAVRAVYNFCDMLPMTNQMVLLEPQLPDLFHQVLQIAQGYSTEVLGLCLETMESLLKVNSVFTQTITEKAMPFFMAVFLKYSHDQHLIELCKELLKQLSIASNAPVQDRMLPTLVSIIQQQDPDKLPSSLKPSALEMLETLVRGSHTPISDQLMSVFPFVANISMQTDDSSIMQNGGEVLRAYVSKSAEQIVHWHDDRGQSGLAYIGLVVSKLLDPKSPESSAAYVGKLVSMLISKLGDKLGSDLDLILRAVLSKLQQTDTLTIVQELIIVFARLLLANVEPLLDFLTLTPGPDGSPALKFVLTQWCSRQHLFFGAYETKIGAMALSKLLLHAINTNDQRLQGIFLREEVINQSNVIRTRSKAKENAPVYQDTPVLIKVYKLLINELSHQMEEAAFNAKYSEPANGANNEEDEYEDVDSDEEDGEFISDLLADEYLDDDEEDDPDVLSDPIYQVNLKDYLTEFLQSFSQTPYYGTFREHHTNQEKKILAHIGIPVN